MADDLARLLTEGGSDWVLGPNRFGMAPRHPGWIENRRAPGYAGEDMARDFGDALREGNIPLAVGTGGGLAMSALPGAKLPRSTGQRPTAGTMPSSPRQSAVERGKEGMYGLEGRPFEPTRDTVLGMPLEEAQRQLRFYEHLKKAATDPNQAFAREARRQLSYMDRNHMTESARWIIEQHHAGPRSASYWDGLAKWETLQPPTRALSQDATGRFYDKNRMD